MIRRGLLLLFCLAAGVAIGPVGEGYTGDAAWFLAIPACVALGWLFVADPGACLACDAGTGRRGDDTGS